MYVFYRGNRGILKGRFSGTDRLLERALRESSSDILMYLITHNDGRGVFGMWSVDHTAGYGG